MNEKTLSEFGDYLLSHRDEITAEWVLAVKRGPGFNLPGYFNDSELVDHLPEVFQELVAVLKAPQSHDHRSEVSRTARKHGRYRWRQGYKLDQVVHEASIIRRILVGTWVNASPGKCPPSLTKLEARPNSSFTKQWMTLSLIRLNNTWKNSCEPFE